MAEWVEKGHLPVGSRCGAHKTASCPVKGGGLVGGKRPPSVASGLLLRPTSLTVTKPG